MYYWFSTEIIIQKTKYDYSHFSYIWDQWLLGLHISVCLHRQWHKHFSDVLCTSLTFRYSNWFGTFSVPFQHLKKTLRYFFCRVERTRIRLSNMNYFKNRNLFLSGYIFHFSYVSICADPFIFSVLTNWLCLSQYFLSIHCTKIWEVGIIENYKLGEKLFWF